MRMNEDPPMCPICGGLHPAGHRDKELEDKLEAVKTWYKENIPDWITSEVSRRQEYLFITRAGVTIKSGKLLELDKILEESK